MSTASVRQARTAQHRLNTFLHAELLHTLGAYHLAEDKLDSLRKKFGDRTERDLRTSIEESCFYNKVLRRELHKPRLAEFSKGYCRHPSPFNVGEDEEEAPDTDLLVSIRGYYLSAKEALGQYLRAVKQSEEGSENSEESDGERLGRRLAYIHDPQRQGHSKNEKQLVEHRLLRTSHRLEKIDELIRLEGEKLPPLAPSEGFEPIISDHMGPKPRKEGEEERRERTPDPERMRRGTTSAYSI